jgi:hypothetical protein
MGEVIRFPARERIAPTRSSRRRGKGGKTVIILPVVRIERSPDALPWLEPRRAKPSKKRPRRLRQD